MFAFFDYSEPLIFFILDYLAVMILFMAVGCLVIRILNKVDEAQKKRRRIAAGRKILLGDMIDR